MGHPSAVIIIPWRDKGDPWRRTNLDIVLSHLRKMDIAPVDVVDDNRIGDAPFNRSTAYNRGFLNHPGADVYVFHEADMIISSDQLQRAISAAYRHPGLVVPFDTYRYLSAHNTEQVHTGQDPAHYESEYVMTDGRSVGAVNVVSFETFARVGCWDETFEGWGYDDRAMARAFEVATRKPTRFIPGHGIHLWHTPGWSTESKFRGGADVPEQEQLATLANKHRYQTYRNAHTPERIRELTAGGR